MAEPVRSPNPSLRERVSALRNLPPFLRQIWATSRALTLASLGLRLIARCCRSPRCTSAS